MNMLRLGPDTGKVYGLLPVEQKDVSTASNVGMDGMLSQISARPHHNIIQGIVVRAGVGTYDTVVNVGEREPYTCCILSTPLSNSHGVAEAVLYPEGTSVLVLTTSELNREGVILGAVPGNDSPDEERSTTVIASTCELEASASVFSDSAYTDPLKDDDYPFRRSCNARRPVDVLPGMYALLNEQRVGLFIAPLTTALRATSRAQVRVSAIDDNVRIVAGHLEVYNPVGIDSYYNDESKLTLESFGSKYQWERFGASKPNVPVVEENEVEDDDDTQTAFKSVKEGIVPRKRWQSFLGFLGDVFNFWVAKPDPDIDIETLEDENKDQGLFHANVSSSGRLMVRSASGITLQRWDRIPVPKRKKYPWDPEGDSPEDMHEEPREPFEWDEGHPYGRSLQHRDAIAWYTGRAYYNLKAHGNDFHVPSEAELSTPDDDYDINHTENFSKNDLRQACMSVEDDGSIILRDAWGSEILMRGGSIIFNAASNIEVRSGKSTVVLAGHDAVIKGKHSVDVTATENDVRIKAENNVQIVAASEERGSILIESLAEGGAGVEGTGEEASGSSIVIKAQDASVALHSKRTYLSGDDSIAVSSSPEKDKGRVDIGGGMVLVGGDKLVSIGAGDESSILVGKKMVALAAPSVMAAGARAVNITKGSKFLIPLLWADIPLNLYDRIHDSTVTIYELFDSRQWLGLFDYDYFEDTLFTYRTDEEYGTNEAVELDADTYYVYQPAWVHVLGDLVEVETWEDEEIEETKPWPGTSAVKYVKYSGDVNVVPDTGIANEELSNTGGEFTPSEFSEYEVVSH